MKLKSKLKSASASASAVTRTTKFDRALRDLEVAHNVWMNNVVWTEQGKAARRELNRAERVYNRAYRVMCGASGN